MFGFHQCRYLYLMLVTFSSYSLFGIVGFLIDFTIFNCLFFVSGMNFMSRGISYFSATVVTWSLNTIYTFKYGGADRFKLSHYFRYVLSQMPAIIANIGLHMMLLQIFQYSTWVIVFIYFLNGIVALFINYFMSHKYIFKQ